MILYPAIDLKDGACVRLWQGDMEKVVRFNDDPSAQAKSFAAAGFAWLHVVDLDGAVAGRAVNGDAVRKIVEAIALPVQLGGGIRDLDAIEAWLAAGISRVVLGTIALEQPDLVVEAARRHPEKIAVGIDAWQGRVATKGWKEATEVKALDLARRYEDANVAAIIYTDIQRDGTMRGPNLEATAALAEALDVPVIASGGFASLDDVRALKACEASGIAGAIIGRALYDGRIDPKEALRMAEETDA
ncbi:MAG: 1-(5-phosphoribosyl)-5-[(5-phosphoribosylamino)methylideneamino]imidazole-4-carboxamide isomerase [Alphaproteobacteria bacterium]|nr:1-(5-phosphoribosyl)-5-[(5-phosphoribosylamino)methylideneamino]imidazole-4-carboxamide isomerase [Alphaproteobacteria bacterium]